MKTTITFEDKKKKAIELMEELGIYKPYIYVRIWDNLHMS